MKERSAFSGAAAALAAAALLASARPARGAEAKGTEGGPAVEPIPVLEVPAAKAAPAVDGRLAPGEWDGAAAVGPLRPSLQGAWAAKLLPDTKVRVMHDRDFLYVSFACTDDDIDCTGRFAHDGELYKEDVTEVFIDAEGDGRCYAELIVAPNGVTLDCLHTFPEPPGTAPDFRVDAESRRRMVSALSWEMKGLRTAAARTEKGWSSEFAIPFASLPRPAAEGRAAGEPRPAGGPPPAAVRVQFVRYDRLREGPENRRFLHQTWSTISEGSPHVSPARMGRLVLTGK